MSYRLGVDLGTTYTSAAVDRGQGPTMVGLGNRALQVPSVLLLQDDGTFRCGELAESRARAEPDRVVREFKRRIGDTVPILVDGQPFSPQALTAKLLAWVVEVVSEREGGPPDEVVITHPANWGGYKRELVDQVIQLAGLDGIRTTTLTEPEAAAAQYASRASVSPGDTVAVYDLGGGTFDVCVLRFGEAGFGVIGSPNGIEHLGGIDFDEALFQHVLGMLPDDVLADPEPSEELTEAVARLRRYCVEAKEELSDDVDATIPVLLPNLSRTVRVTRAEFEHLIAPALQDTIEATRRALRSADVSAEDLASVVLVGGSSRIPLVSHLIREELGAPAAMDSHPKHDIALGAARRPTPTASGEALEASPAPEPAPSVMAWPSRGGEDPEESTLPLADPEADPGQAEPDPDPAAATTRPLAPTPPEWTPRTPVSPVPGSGSGGSGGSGLGGRTRALAWAGGVVAALVLAGVTYVVVSDRDEGGGAAGDPTPSASGPAPAAPIVSAEEIVVPRALDAGGSELVAIDARNGQERQLVESDAAVLDWPNPSRARDRVVFSEESPTGLPVPQLLDATGQARPLLGPWADQDCPGAGRPVWGPDDAQLALVCFNPATPNLRKLMLVGEDGSPGRVLTSAGRLLSNPTWVGTDSIVVSAAASAGERFTFHQIPVDGSAGLAPLDPEEREPNVQGDWSPAGMILARGQEGERDVYLLPVDGSPRSLTDRGDVTTVGWAPDDQRFVYATGTGADVELWVQSVDDTEPPSEPLATGAFGDPSWGSR